ncbi:MAG: class I SAM-dependent methyltransferase [Humidesulfovibrio sp.]|nr:class I SAM-dependent methyltransferase [Humidesulfovibrio sp.]
MHQQKQSSTEQVIRNAVYLLAKGGPDDFNQLYRQRKFEQVAQVLDAACAVMDFSYEKRANFYTYVYNRLVRKVPVDYLEFGVATGESFRVWLGLSRHAESRFYGFDSFEGLPENWQADSPKGAYSTGGHIPQVDDPRATFIKGLFQQTVDAFSLGFTPQNRLVLHMDADLYSSTLYVLMTMNRHIRPGTLILFDEFTARGFTDEYAALEDYCTACCRSYQIRARRRDFVKLAVEITA